MLASKEVEVESQVEMFIGCICPQTSPPQNDFHSSLWAPMVEFSEQHMLVLGKIIYLVLRAQLVEKISSQAERGGGYSGMPPSNLHSSPVPVNQQNRSLSVKPRTTVHLLCLYFNIY